MNVNRILLPMFLAAGLVSLSSVTSAQVNEEAAKETMKRSDCSKCHSVDKTKKGPSLKKIAAKYKGKADAEQKLLDNVTKEPMVKLDDGTEEKHKRVDTDDPKELKNLFKYILSR